MPARAALDLRQHQLSLRLSGKSLHQRHLLEALELLRARFTPTSSPRAIAPISKKFPTGRGREIDARRRDLPRQSQT